MLKCTDKKGAVKVDENGRNRGFVTYEDGSYYEGQLIDGEPDGHG